MQRRAERGGFSPAAHLPCAQYLPLCVQELQELERKLEDQLAHQEAAQLQRALDSWQQWAGEGPASTYVFMTSLFLNFFDISK